MTPETLVAVRHWKGHCWKDGAWQPITATVRVEVDVDDLVRLKVWQALRNRTGVTKLCAGAIRVILSEVFRGPACDATATPRDEVKS